MLKTWTWRRRKTAGSRRPGHAVRKPPGMPTTATGHLEDWQAVATPNRRYPFNRGAVRSKKIGKSKWQTAMTMGDSNRADPANRRAVGSRRSSLFHYLYVRESGRFTE
jgi:hypothetical protein